MSLAQSFIQGLFRIKCIQNTHACTVILIDFHREAVRVTLKAGYTWYGMIHKQMYNLVVCESGLKGCSIRNLTELPTLLHQAVNLHDYYHFCYYI